MAKNVFRRGQSGRLDSGALVKKTRYSNAQLVADDFFEASAANTLTPPLIAGSNVLYAATVANTGPYFDLAITPSEVNGNTVASVTSGTLALTATSVVVVMWTASNGLTSPTIANTGTAITWTNFVTQSVANQDDLYCWYGISASAQNITVTVTPSTSKSQTLRCLVIENAVTSGNPIANITKGGPSTATSVSATITPSTNKSQLFGMVSDFNATNSFAALSGNTLDSTYHLAGGFTTAVVRPTTNPPGVVSTTIGVSQLGTSSTNWAFFEVVPKVNLGGAATLTQTSTLSNSQTFFAPTVTRGTVTLTPGLQTNTSSVFAPSLAAGAVTLTPPLLTNGNTLYAATVTRGAVTLVPGLVTNSSSVFAPTVTASVTLTPGLVTNTSSVYGPTLAVGGVTLTPPAIASTGALFGPTVTTSGGATQTLTPGLVTNTSSVFAPTVTVGAVGLTPPLLASSNSLFAPTVTRGTVTLTPPLLTNSSTVYAPTVVVGAVTLTPPLLSVGNTLYAPSVAAGLVTVTPPLLTNASTPYAPSVAPGTVALAPSLYTNTASLFTPAVSGASYSISPTRANLIYELALLHGLVPGNPLSVSATQRSAGALSQSITGTDTVTITKTSSDVLQGNLNDWIDALAAVHGLTTPLVVTATSRSAGTLSQAIATTGGTTTVGTV